MTPPSDSNSAGNDAVPSSASIDEPKQKGRVKRLLLGYAMRYLILRKSIGIHAIYRDTGGGLIGEA